MTKSTPVDVPFDGEAIRRGLAALPVEQREVVVLRVWHEHSFRDIGTALGISTHTAASRWRYGIDKLETVLRGKEVHE